MLQTSIPAMQLPGKSLSNKFIDEPLVSITECFKKKIIVSPEYYLRKIPGAVSVCMVRKGVRDRLASAMEYLPENITFKVYDAWRPIKVQQFLYDSFYKKVKQRNPDFDEAQIKKEIKPFVSSPVYDEDNPMVHSTGGAIDLTLFDLKTKTELDLGTDFDDFSEKAHTCFFENTVDEAVKNNRRILYNSMIKAGFTNLPSEWWHYDYGDGFWSYYTGEPAIYGGIKE